MSDLNLPKPVFSNSFYSKFIVVLLRMKDEEKTREQLIQELAEMHQQIAELEALEADRKQVELALRESEERYRELFDHMSNGVAVYEAIENGKDFVFKDLNKAGERISRVNKDDMIGKRVSEIFPGVKEFGLLDVFQRVFKTGKPVHHPISLYKDERISHWVENSVYKLPTGKVVAVYDDISNRKQAEEELKKYRDHLEVLVEKRTVELKKAVTEAKRLNEQLQREINERKRAEETLRESEEKYRTLTEDVLDNTRVGIFILDSAFRIVWVNQALEDYFGLRKNQVIGQDKRQLIHERIQYIFDDPEHFANTVLATYDKNTYIEEFECHIVRSDNRQERWLEHRSQPILSGLYIGGRVELYYDITKRKQAEKQLQQYAVEVKEANAELSQYAYVVSHDLKAPLRAIHNYSDFLREDLETTLEGEQKEYFNGLDNAVKEAQLLIDDLLELSRIGRQRVDIETIGIGPFLQALIPSLDLSDDVEIVMEDDWPIFDTEPVLFRQIFQNLISNAVKFNISPQKHVEVGWRPIGENRYEFFVHDNGIGIDPHHQEKIFRVFERLHTKNEFEGTGIGLAIVKKAVGKLGGTVRVKSQPGEGSTFFVILPRTKTNLE